MQRHASMRQHDVLVDVKEEECAAGAISEAGGASEYQ